MTNLRGIARYCTFPDKFADEALRDAFCQGISSDNVRKAVCRDFATFQRLDKHFCLNDAIAAAEIESSATTA